MPPFIPQRIQTIDILRRRAVEMPMVFLSPVAVRNELWYTIPNIAAMNFIAAGDVNRRKVRESAMTKSILKRESLSKQVSDQLEKMISSGTYAVGEKIPTEPELAEMFQVSRNTVREAVQSLTWSGLLSVKQGDGTYVCASDRFQANMEQKYQEVSLEDIKEIRNCLEVTIAHLAAQRRSAEDIEQIRAMLLRRKTLTEDVKENTRTDLDFHLAIAKACRNGIMIDMYESISCYLEKQIEVRNQTSSLSTEEIDRLHEVLFSSIERGEPEQASAAVTKILEI